MEAEKEEQANERMNEQTRVGKQGPFRRFYLFHTRTEQVFLDHIEPSLIILLSKLVCIEVWLRTSFYTGAYN